MRVNLMKPSVLNRLVFYSQEPWLYSGVKLLAGLVKVDVDPLKPILPEGFELAEDLVPAIFLAFKASSSSFGYFREAVIAVQASISNYQEVFYFPLYVYTSFNDYSMAAGREVIGLPKKTATIRFSSKGRIRRVLVSRGGPLLYMEFLLEKLGDEKLLREIFPAKIKVAGIRLLPPVAGRGFAQLLLWYVKVNVRRSLDMPLLWSGSMRIKVAGTIEDPLLDYLRIREVVSSFYGVVDAEVGVEDILGEWRLS